jgi:peptidoglycan/LPS O-acetylase OafA/YrhL
MMIVVSVFAVILMLPVELVRFAKSLRAAVFSVSNFYFWRHSGYFDLAISYPLLHTWSLAVEEQFYLVFPLFLMLVRRFSPRRMKIAVVLLTLASLLVSVAVVRYSRDTDFYMPYTRVWELLTGTVLSLGLFPRLQAQWQRNTATLTGLALILYSVMFFSNRIQFPGLYALVPCIGSALIIGTGESGPSLVGSVLSSRPIVFIGLISYSLYLWHWPVIVFHGIGALFSMGTTVPHQYAGLLSLRKYDQLVQTAVSFTLAILSWRFVEQPFRKGSLRLSGKPLFVAAGVSMGCLLAFATMVIYGSGFPQRFPQEAVRIAAYVENVDAKATLREGTCFLTSDEPFADFDSGVCLRQVEGQKNYLLIGDSHSASLWKAFSTAFPDANIMQASAAGCRLFVHPLGPPDCQRMMTYIFQDYLPAHPVQGLLLSDRWLPGDGNKIGETVEWAKAHGIPVAIIGPVQEYDAPLPRLMAYSIAWNRPDLLIQHRTAENAAMDAHLESLAENNWHVPYISLYKAICNNGVCIEYADAEHKIPLMLDTDHLSEAGSLLIVQRLIEQGKLEWVGK